MDNFANFNDKSLNELHFGIKSNTNPNRNTTRAEYHDSLSGAIPFEYHDNLTKDFFRPISRVISAS